jgi:CheY-like chemotaxis protein
VRELVRPSTSPLPDPGCIVGRVQLDPQVAAAVRVVVVDDNADFADSLATLLGMAGYDPVVYYDGPSALAALDHVRPSVWLIDLRLPGMDGLELARWVRAWGGGRVAYLAAVTARCDEEALRQTAEAGFDIHLVKPVDPTTC